MTPLSAHLPDGLDVEIAVPSFGDVKGTVRPSREHS